MRPRTSVSVWLVLGGIGLLLAAGPALAQKRVALVIGVAAYKQLPALNNPVSDARAVATLLETYGIATTVLPNPTHAEMLVALARFRRIAEDADLALIYYAGHGLNLAGSDVLLPSDTPARCDPKTRVEALAGTVGIDEVIAAARPARNRVIILDACRTAAFPSCPSRGDATVAFRALGRVAEEHRGTLIATSAATGSVASDGPRGGNSPYNLLLRQHLAGKPQSFLHEVLFDVNRELGSRPSGQQPSLHFAHGVPPAVCLKVEGCGTSPEEAELERLRAMNKDLRNRREAAVAQRHDALRQVDDAKRAEAIRKAQEIAEVAKANGQLEANKKQRPSDRTVVAALPKLEKPIAEGRFDGRWVGSWEQGRQATATIVISGDRVTAYYYNNSRVPVSRSTASGKVITFGSTTYTVILTFLHNGVVSANYRHHTRGNPNLGTLKRQ